MRTIKLGNGPWAGFSLVGTVVRVGDAENGIDIDCAAYQSDTVVTVDVVKGVDGNLAIGVSPGTSYVATVEIPQQVITHETRLDENDNSVLDDNDQPIIDPVKQPLNVDALKLHLWPTTQNNEPAAE